MSDKLFVVIPTTSRADLLRRTLASLSKCRLPSSFCGVTVIENGGSPSVESIVRNADKSLCARYLYDSVGNKSRALNRVLKDLPDDGLVYFTDDDVRMDENVLEEFDDAAGERKHGMFFGGPVAIDYEEPPPDWMLPYFPLSVRGFDMGRDEQIVDYVTFLGINWAAFVGDVRRVGGFNEAIGPELVTGGTEWDLEKRLVDVGIKGRYLPRALVWHYVPKERCSQAWALKRAYKKGVYQGMQYDAKAAPRMWGIPRWMMGAALRCRLNQFKTYCLGNKEARFEASYEYALAAGTIKGFQHRTRHS